MLKNLVDIQKIYDIIYQSKKAVSLFSLTLIVVAFLFPLQTLIAYAYVANNASNNVSVINTANNSVVATITVGTNPSYIAVNGNYAYVASSSVLYNT